MGGAELRTAAAAGGGEGDEGVRVERRRARRADEAADDGAAAGLDPAGEAGAQVDDLHRRRALGLGGGVADGLGLEEERHVRQRGEADDDAHVRPRAAERVREEAAAEALRLEQHEVARLQREGEEVVRGRWRW